MTAQHSTVQHERFYLTLY